MSESTTRPKKRAGTTDDSTDLPRGLIGVDAEGARHEIDPTTRTVFVHRAGDVEHTEALEGRAIREWVAYVDEQRGWDDLRYVDDPLAGLVESVGEATEAR
jgi:hypothetical protein